MLQWRIETTNKCSSRIHAGTLNTSQHLFPNVIFCLLLLYDSDFLNPLGCHFWQIFFLWFIYDLNTISIYDFFMGSNCGYDFLWFGYDFFMVLDMIFLWFFYVFLVLRIWFSAIKTREIFDFFMILLEFPFPQSLFSRKFDFGSKSVKNRKKIVNASKVPRIWFSAKNWRNFRFFYDFARVSLGKSLKNRKKIVNASKVPRI